MAEIVSERRDGRDRREDYRRESDRLAHEQWERERRETVRQISDLLFIVQEMGQRLAYETHGANYQQVVELNQSLHDARLLLDKIVSDRGTNPSRCDSDAT